ncbi:hypothetical protein CEP54_001066 [Fusarium duplospermum]|uniref:Major facilitator superfamily (MFS) profile domain-containing protein n=1 Tax=Fusarium duplospermum TaxID=1325734 RepID=A0A428R396_9HYPO|nr:hypothetical protein CEP54_001066 [Fusarium duplospermum]
MVPSNNSKEADIRITIEEIPEEFDLARLGRQRPEVFKSTWTEVAFVASMVTSLAATEFFVGGFQILIPGISDALNIPQDSQTWLSSVITLVAGSFLFPCARLVDMFGGYLLFHVGILWVVAWSVVTGFSKTFFMLVFCRAMQGLGAAAFLPAGVSLIGRTYRPGPRKNLVFSLYGAMVPVMFFLGTMCGGMVQQYLTWGWYFWLITMILTPAVCISLWASPRDYAEARKGGNTMDWWGVGTLVPGLLLVIYAITDSRRYGWTAPHIIATLVVGCAFLITAVFVEGWVASAPLVPPEIFQVKGMKKMLGILSLKFGVYSVFLFYANFYIKSVLGKDPMTASVWFAPWAAGGMVLSISSGLLLHILSGQIILILCGVAKVIAILLFALMPNSPSYWAWVFPALMAEGACISVLSAIGNVFMTSTLPRHLLGLAGALIFVASYLASAFLLAIIAVVVGVFESKGWDLKAQHKGVFWIAFGLACLALILDLFIKLPKAGCEDVEESKSKKADLESDLSETESPSVFATPSDQLSINEEAANERDEEERKGTDTTEKKNVEVEVKVVRIHDVLKDFV